MTTTQLPRTPAPAGAKYATLGLRDRLAGVPGATPEALASARRVLEDHGLRAT